MTDTRGTAGTPTGRVAGKVALVTGAARGQGKSHAVRLAEEGADIILLDLCRDIETNGYPLATPRDLEEAVLEVEKTGRRAISAEVDVRDRAAIDAAVAAAVAEFGHLDIVVANAGICPLGDGPLQAFADAFDVDLVGATNTIHAGLPHLNAGASIIATGSVAALLAAGSQGGPSGAGGAGYVLAKEMLTTYVHRLAQVLAPKSIRANIIHPTNVNTPMLQSTPMYRQFRPDLADPGPDDVTAAFASLQAMPEVPWIEPADVSEAVVYLASDASRYVTGLDLTIDAGAILGRGGR
ncbi:mycofactocin-coupled SDR family oxidoreductase [Gordonia sp. zg691]|uniref:mycofactocin-coupled SDR family oxidoreductase n=1 Tax=Gordonia jinghuaiqii TaxID=2758710 RepID=UPI0016627E05|nr:mycofactocin-coupled SDR family oxidoreductase [Gordonia jinghuaiqii]MBD0862499.1 mycofactocin-coupled SDR family oxidoreductase [Gordonia jinghuaiqii]